MTAPATKEEAYQLFHDFIHQRPGLDPGNYSGTAAYNTDRYTIKKQLHQAEDTLRWFNLREYSQEALSTALDRACPS